MVPADRFSDTVHTTSFDDDERPSHVVVTAVAALTDTSPLELPPIYDAIDPDALDALFARARESDEPGACRLAFAYRGFDVRIEGDGRIEIAERSRTSG